MFVQLATTYIKSSNKTCSFSHIKSYYPLDSVVLSPKIAMERLIIHLGFLMIFNSTVSNLCDLNIKGFQPEWHSLQ